MGLLPHLIAFPLLLVVLVGCADTARVEQGALPGTVPASVTPTDTSRSPLIPTAAPRPQATPTVTARPGSPMPRADTPPPCAVTSPNGSMPDAGWESPSHGNGMLWTLFWPNNTVLATPEYVDTDGSIRMKWPWSRGVAGRLTVEGRRLDAPAPPLRADVPNGYGDSGFQPSVLYFSTQGCWEVTGRVGDASLTFVTLVVKVDRPPRTPPAVPTRRPG